MMSNARCRECDALVTPSNFARHTVLCEALILWRAHNMDDPLTYLWDDFNCCFIDSNATRWHRRTVNFVLDPWLHRQNGATILHVHGRAMLARQGRAPFQHRSLRRMAVASDGQDVLQAVKDTQYELAHAVLETLGDISSGIALVGEPMYNAIRRAADPRTTTKRGTPRVL